MTNQSRVTADLSKLENLLKKLGGEYVVKVGYIGNKGSETHPESDLNNAEIAFVHEFGSQSKNIPERSTLRMPLHQKQDDLVKTFSKGKAQEALAKGDILGFYKILGIVAQSIIQEAYATQGFGKWPANKPATIAKKGSSSPLIDTGVLRRAVSSEVVRRSEVDT